MKYVIIIIMMIFSFQSGANPTCSKNGTRIIYTNGIATEKTKAERSMEKIEEIVLIEDIEADIKNIDKKF